MSTALLLLSEAYIGEYCTVDAPGTVCGPVVLWSDQDIWGEQSLEPTTESDATPAF